MKQRIALLVLASASACVYLVVSELRSGSGFPLDDAWIHQVYARNLATNLEFSFFPGQPSAGSTAPLWSMLLAIGYWMHLDFRVWAYILGAVLLGLCALIGARLLERMADSSGIGYPQSKLVSLFLVFEWHLVWSAASGMEILLFIFLSLILLERVYARERRWILGSLAGLLALTRPEGVVFAGLALLGVIFLSAGQRRDHLDAQADYQVDASWGRGDWIQGRVADSLGFIISFALIAAPWLLFNLATSGTFFPNTFYAKSAEYAILSEGSPFLVRWIQLLAVPFIGAQVLLLPGLVYVVTLLAIRRNGPALIPLVWLLAMPALYALRLPVSYQHGRYEMPVIPFVAFYGLWGTKALLGRLKSRVLRATWTLSTAVLVGIFWLLGAAQYSTDVAIVDCEMVKTAQWISSNAQSGEIVAAHDIGALGYFYTHPFIDLAGLVTPEVIPFIREEDRLRDYLISRQATFLVIFPDWYVGLASPPRIVPVYHTNCAITRSQGGQNMVVYRIID